MKSSLDLYRKFLKQTKKEKVKNEKSLVQTTDYKNSLDFAGENKILQNMYKRYLKKKK